MRLLGPNGQPISSSQFRKSAPPRLGPSFGDWAGRDTTYSQAPGGAILQFNLDSLTLQDFRAMRYHPQINSSLCVLTFMLHQIDWRIECEDKKIAQEVDDMIRPLWTRLVRGLSQAFWAGYSPIAIEWENDVDNRRVAISKFKDLIPDDCSVKWKSVEGAPARPGAVPPKLKVFDGIKQWGMPDIPTSHSLWYPLLMENGNYYGRKLLKAAFAPWYFSTLVHLFANRYYERFGEPIPIGRAPFDDNFPTSDPNKEVTGKEAMETILMQLRNRGTVVLPSSTTAMSSQANRAIYDYDIEYLESQMRGADFERYLTRLDEEMSLGLFTPLLLLRNADVGSHNLGVQHTQTWLWMLNALTGDMKEYVDRYALRPLKDYNYARQTPPIRWVPRKLGKENVETLRSIITALVSSHIVRPDLDELGQALGMTLDEVTQVTRDKINGTGSADPNLDTRSDDDKATGPKGVGEPRATGREVSNRVRQQVEKAWRENRFGSNLKISLGFKKRMHQSFVAEGIPTDAASSMTNELYSRLESWLPDVVGLGMEEFSGPNDFMALFERHLDNSLEAVAP